MDETSKIFERSGTFITFAPPSSVPPHPAAAGRGRWLTGSRSRGQGRPWATSGGGRRLYCPPAPWPTCCPEMNIFILVILVIHLD